MREYKLVTSNGIREAISNLWYRNECDIAIFSDTIDDSRDGEEMARNLNKLKLFRKFELSRETETSIRLKGTDITGNISYLIVTK